MKKMTKRAVSAALVLLLMIAVLPFAAMKINAKTDELVRTVPAGYNAHDYAMCAAFLELTDEYGTKNGEKLNGGNYDVNDPATWGTSYGPDDDFIYDYVSCFGWHDNGSELVLYRISVENRDLCGNLDLSNCTSLCILHCPINRLSAVTVSGCTSLGHLTCYGNSFSALDVSGSETLLTLDCASTCITELNVSGCTSLLSVTCQINALTSLDLSDCHSLHYLNCEHNVLAELNVSGCTELYELYCFENELTGLDLSNAAELERLVCYDNRLTELDVSMTSSLSYLDCTANELRLLELPRNDGMALDTVRAEGSGGFGCEAIFAQNDVMLTAYPRTGAEFLGWYDENGERISNSTPYHGPWHGETEVIARFTFAAGEPGSGDIDGDGVVTVGDALLALRIAMGILDAAPQQLEAGEMDGDGVITIADAVILMRVAMGLL